MTENPLVKKLKLKPGQRAAVIGAPEGYLESLQPLPDGVDLNEQLDGSFDWIQLFVTNKAELDDVFPRIVQSLKPDTLLWLSFPKGSSRIQTDLTRDQGWEVVQQAELKWTNLISVNETWSAFSLRPFKPGEERRSFR